jgi:hypothetical protein
MAYLPPFHPKNKKKKVFFSSGILMNQTYSPAWHARLTRG